ncbi:MAG: hypothetical protein ACC642_02200 [Pseudomonadales bacterium]
MQPYQLAIIDQAIRRVLTCYDEKHSLLHSADDRRFRVVQESLAFAALLLSRASAGKTRHAEIGLARRLIDSVLKLQNVKKGNPDHGGFPLVWMPARDQPVVMDPDSREMIGSLLALMLRNHPQLLGETRSQRILKAIKRTIRPPDQPPPGISGKMVAAWLDIEFGDDWRGERLATDIVLAGSDHFVESRFGNATVFAQELWALSLWRRSSRLHDSVSELKRSIMDDINSYAHPELPELFGSVTTSASFLDNAYSWLGAWLTWHAHGSQPLLPGAMSDPLHATRFAFPMLAKLKLGPDEETESADASVERTLSYCHGGRSITGWRESGLHIEARECSIPEGSRLPVAGARWITRQGSSVWMRCRASRNETAVCRKRFVHLENPGTTTVSVHNLGEGEARMIDNGWWLSGLHFATEGFQMVDAERTSHGLELKLRPVGKRALLMFSPLK